MILRGHGYYTVFLQEVIRYLDLKRTLNELDGAFVYARDALLHYARWMADKEQPYLCLLYTSPSPRDATLSRMPSSA